MNDNNEKILLYTNNNLLFKISNNLINNNALALKVAYYFPVY